MAEALAHAQAVIAPSQAAKEQLHIVMAHLPETQVIEPEVHKSISQLRAGEGSDLIVLVPGNLAINKGYVELRNIIEQSNELGLPIEFRVLGRVESWIEQEMSSNANVKLLGRYDNKTFARHAAGADVALFLSPWPETYCITFEEWKRSGRACFYYAIGALAEAHRQEGLHQASAGFAVEDREGLMSALIKATTPGGLKHLREANKNIQILNNKTSFGEQHWLLFAKFLSNPKKIITHQVVTTYTPAMGR